MMLLGKYYQNGAYRPWMTVDVRDDAECHIRLLENVDIENGDRFIAWSTDTEMSKMSAHPSTGCYRN